MCKDCTVETITVVFSTNVLVQIMPFRHYDKKYYWCIPDNDGAPILRCGHQPLPGQAIINGHGSLYNNQLSSRGGGGVMRAPHWLRGTSTPWRCTVPYTRIPNVGNDSTAIRHHGCHMSSSWDKIGGHGRQWWLMERGGGTCQRCAVPLNR